MDRKTIFDTVRAMLGRGFLASEVVALDRALGDAEPIPGGAHAVGPAGLALIRKWEGCAQVGADGLVAAYPDPGTGGAPWTIGWGSTGRGIGPNTVWSQTECDARLVHDLLSFGDEVCAAIGDAPTSPGQFDALVSFHYNTGAIAKATLTRLHKAGDFAGAEVEFGKWIHAGGRVMRGLVRRRADEAALYRAG